MAQEKSLILAVETSCDETSVAVVRNGNEILANIVASQVKSHQRFGGVVPEVASRHHVEQIIGCFEEALAVAKVEATDLTSVAVTYGPGLVGALLIGVTAAKTFAWVQHLPLIAVNHMAGHLHAAQFTKELQFPLIALLVSGGHTELVYMKEAGSYQIIGETRDDAAGEAYDKVGRVLGLPYPSGKALDQMAHLGQDTYHFPRAMIKEAHFDFSFSGLKSAFINLVHNAEQRNQTLDANDLAASFQASVVDVLVAKTLRACQEYPVRQLIIAGGVAANQGLRERFTEELPKHLPDVELLIPPFALCGDNAAMIAAAAYEREQNQQFTDGHLNAKPGLTFNS